MPHADHLKFNARLDRRLVSTRGGTRHVLVDVRAPRIERPEDESRPPLNLGLVIDASGSMEGEPLDAARTAARGVVDLLRDGDRITLVSFADDVIVHADAVRADGKGRAAAIAAIDTLTTRGCTDLGAGWLEGCERVAAGHGVAARRAAPGDRAVGRPRQPGPDRSRAAGPARGRAAARGLYTSTVGIGDGYSPSQLQAIAEHGGGRLHDAPLGEDIVAVVLGELGEILTTAADDVTLRISHPRRLPVAVLGPFPRTASDGMLEVSAGTLVSGASRQIVLQVTVPRGKEGERFHLEIAPSWKTPAGAAAHGATLAVSFALAPVEEVAAELPDLDTCLMVAAPVASAHPAGVHPAQHRGAVRRSPRLREGGPARVPRLLPRPAGHGAPGARADWAQRRGDA